MAEQYGAVICPDSKAFDAFDAASTRVLTNPPSNSASKPDLVAIWLDTAKPNGCSYIRPGASLVSEGETSDSGGGRPLAIVTAKMPDGTAIRGITFSNMLYSIPKGNVVAADFGAIICPDSKVITAYQDAMTAWRDNNKQNMSAEEFAAAAKSSVEGLAKSAGCNYVHPGTSLVSEGEIEGGNGYGANLNLVVTAQMPDGTAIRGVTIPAMITRNQQPTAEAREPSAAQPKVPQEPETQQEQKQSESGTQATPQAPTTPDLNVIGDDQKHANKVQTLKGRCASARVCDSIALIYPAEYENYVMIMFLQRNRGAYGFSGRLYFDPADDDTKVMVDHVYSPGGEVYSYNGATGKESTWQEPSGWKAQGGGCVFSQNHGSVIAVECGQPMWSFLAAPGQ